MSDSGAGDAISAEVEQMYGALLRGPRKLRLPEGMALPLQTPQGTRALSEAIHSLLEGHVEYIHHAHHHLLPVRLLSSSCIRMHAWPAMTLQSGPGSDFAGWGIIRRH